jgi:hypothetical protein
MSSNHRHEKPDLDQRSATADWKNSGAIKVSIMRRREGIPFFLHTQKVKGSYGIYNVRRLFRN